MTRLIQPQCCTAGADRPIRGLASKIVLEYAEIENVIFANTNSASAAIYAKNPGVVVTNVQSCSSNREDGVDLTEAKQLRSSAKIRRPQVSISSLRCSGQSLLHS
jgi:hypothetical protein